MITTLKEAIHQIIDNSPIPSRTLAEELGISYSYLMNAANPDLPDFKLPARHIIPLTRLTGDFAAVDFIENSLGRTALALPAGNSTIKEIRAELFDAVGSFGDLVKKSTDALADGRVTAVEAIEIEQQGYHLINEVLEFMQAVERCRNKRRGHVG